MRGHRVRNSILTRLRLRPTRRVKRVAPIAGSSRALVEQSSGRTDERSKRLQEANPYDRSLGDDNTERGRYPQPSREAFGRGDRPDVPQRLCTEVAARTRNCVVFPRASRTACAICGGDEPDEPELRCEAGKLRGTTRASAGSVSQRPAQRRGDGRASAQIPA